LAKSAPGAWPLMTIRSLQACREGGTLAVPFQDRDHGMVMEHRTMIFFCALRGPSVAPLLWGVKGVGKPA
jgi:hypothetical protein